MAGSGLPPRSADSELTEAKRPGSLGRGDRSGLRVSSILLQARALSLCPCEMQLVSSLAFVLTQALGTRILMTEPSHVPGMDKACPKWKLAITIMISPFPPAPPWAPTDLEVMV